MEASAERPITGVVLFTGDRFQGPFQEMTLHLLYDSTKTPTIYDSEVHVDSIDVAKEAVSDILYVLSEDTPEHPRGSQTHSGGMKPCTMWVVVILSFSWRSGDEKQTSVQMTLMEKGCPIALNSSFLSLLSFPVSSLRLRDERTQMGNKGFGTYP